ATTPAHAAGTVSIVVTNSDARAGTLANNFIYYAPTVTSVSPSSGSTAGGTSVTITGAYFATGATVTVGGAAATGVTVEIGRASCRERVESWGVGESRRE